MNSPSSNIGMLIAEVSRLMRRAFESKRDAASLTLSQARTLLYLSRHEGINQVQLAELLEVQPITLARQIDQFEGLGLVARRADPQDRRAYRLFLLPASTDFLAEIRKTTAAVRAQAYRGLDKDEVETLSRCLQTIRSNLTATASINENHRKSPENEASA